MTRPLVASLLLAAGLAGSACADVLAPVAVWGTPGSEPGQLFEPAGVALSPLGHVLVADRGNHRIQEFTADGAFVNTMGGWAGDIVDGPGHGLFTQGPNDVVADRMGFVWGGDSGFRDTGFLQRFTSAGVASFDWGNYNGYGCNGFDRLTQLAIGMLGYVYLLDEHRSIVFRADVTPVDPNHIAFCPLILLWDVWPRGFAIAGPRDEILFVGDARERRIRRYDLGYYNMPFGEPGEGPGQIGELGAMVSDRTDHLYVVDRGNHKILVFKLRGAFEYEWGEFGTGPGQFDFRRGGGITLDPEGNVWVADTGNHRIQKFTPRTTPTAGTTWGAIKSRWR